MQSGQGKPPTIGVLAGWQLRGQLYGRVSRRSFPDSLLRGIQAAAQDHGCNLVVACGIGASTSPTVTRPAWPVLAPDADFLPVGPWNTDGLIVILPLLSEARSQDIRALQASGYPIVFVGTAEGGPAVGIDNEGGIRQAIEHLIAHGHRRIAFIAGQPRDEAGDSGERLRAYQTILQEYGLIAEPELIAYGLHLFEGGKQAMQQILASGVAFTAVLASNDESALGAMQVLREAGRRVPEDVAVIGFDNQYEAAFHDPPLTTVHCSIFERGYRALELLLAHMAGQAAEQTIIPTPTRLIVRQSCGCPPHSTIPASLATSESENIPADFRQWHSWLGKALAEALHTESQQRPVTIQDSCHRLAAAFLQDWGSGNTLAFPTALKTVLQETEKSEEEIHVWQAAISVLAGILPRLQAIWPVANFKSIDTMLQQARILISETVQQQNRRTIAEHRRETDQVGLLTTRLLRALDREQIFSVLGEHLPHLGIPRIGIAFFEAEGNDPVAWSNLRVIPGPARSERFPSRAFPPPGLYPPPFHLILLPLNVESGEHGFAVFDMRNLELCGTIVWQLTEALRSARLYHEATEGRRLAEEANRLKTRLLSTVSHELRTPISLIVGLSQMLYQETQDVLPENHRQDLERIYVSAQQLDGLIRDVLDLARSEIGQLHLVCEPLNLGEVIQPIALVGEQMAHDKGLTWRVDIPPRLPAVWGDRTRLRQVLLNLISNAIKFTTKGEVGLAVTASPENVVISVSDTGLGIPPEEQEAIFDEFRQSERTAARGYGGLGLGLAICQRLIELHGGHISVSSSGQEGQGSTFSVTLPILKGERPAGQKSERIAEHTVLLLTAKEKEHILLQEHLARRGFAVELAAIEKRAGWMSRLSDYAMVIVDASQSSLQLWETLKVLKGNPLTRDVPLLVYALEEQGGSVLELDYLTKPIGALELAHALERQGYHKGEKKTILVVDDESGVLEMHARILHFHFPAYRVLKAHNGREALEIIRQEHPDLVLLDLMMPELDGFGVLEEMQRGETTWNIPVIVLTGQELTERELARLNRGVTAVLGKGLFSVKETLAHIEQALERRKRLSSETHRLVRQAMAYIHEHYAEPLSLQEISRRIGVSEEYLARCFRRELGITPVSYLNRYRVSRAKELLSTTEDTITAIASAVGFSDGSYFSRVFRGETGLSPREYRRGRRVPCS